MGQAAQMLLASWVNFYVIIGSSAGALTGLQFVVMTLIAELRRPGTTQDIRAFGTPTVVHFCAALLVAAVMSAPWPSVSNLDFCIAICGALGVAYALKVLRHAKEAPYNPDVEDWMWYGVLPLIAYILLASGAIVLRWHLMLSLFLIAGTTLLLLFIGIHNAWDTVTYIAIQHRQAQQTSEPKDEG